VTFTVAAAGDIAGRFNAQAYTGALLTELRREGLAAVLALGDLQYMRGEYHDFLADYAPAWGTPELRALTRPVPGNHEYDQGRTDAEGYFDYFDGRGATTGQAGSRGLGYYSYDMGDWHLVALNTSDGCQKIRCGPGSAMHRWLVDDLARTSRRCVLAYFHHPRFQQGELHHDSPAVAPLWDALYDAGVEIALAAHDHNYQQLAPLDKQGRPDRAHGVRSFVVGTGGARLYPWFDDRLHPDVVEARAGTRYGVLALTLGPGRYSWRFLAVGAQAGGEELVSGKDVCH
jgi:hypothetical protein